MNLKPLTKPDQDSYWAQALQQKLNRSIPLSQAMQLQVNDYSRNGLRLAAPLQPNINDKGTAFGGSLATVLTLCGWGLLWVRCQQAEIDCDLVIVRGFIRYRHPVTADFEAVCDAPSTEHWERFLRRLDQRKRARIKLHSYIAHGEAAKAVQYELEYAALMKSEK